MGWGPISRKIALRTIQALRNADGGGGVRFSGEKGYEGVRLKVISVTRGWVWVQFPEKKRYVTLEWSRNNVVPALGDHCREWHLPYADSHLLVVRTCVFVWR